MESVAYLMARKRGELAVVVDSDYGERLFLRGADKKLDLAVGAVALYRHEHRAAGIGHIVTAQIIHHNALAPHSRRQRAVGRACLENVDTRGHRCKIHIERRAGSGRPLGYHLLALIVFVNTEGPADFHRLLLAVGII